MLHNRDIPHLFSPRRARKFDFSQFPVILLFVGSSDGKTCCKALFRDHCDWSDTNLSS